MDYTALALGFGLGAFAALMYLRTKIESWRGKYAAEQLKCTKLEAQIEGKEQAHNEKIDALTAIRKEIEEKFENITSSALRNNQGTFLQLADENFKKHKEKAEAELEARKKAVETLISPLSESLKAYKEHIETLEKDRKVSYGALDNELKNVVATQKAVQNETAKLVNALRAAPKTRGRWGEHTLRRVLELAELSEHCDFCTEESFERDGKMLRPDATINLPGDRKLFVDAKTPLSAYLDAVDATDENERDRLLALHVKQVRDHINQLASKEYWDNLDSTPDFVVMFIPGDNFYTAAAEREPVLFEYAAAKRVVIVTPATLIALAKAVAYGWRQEKIAENHRKVHEAGRELYKRLTTMTSHIINCGEAIRKSVEHFNKFIGSLEDRVMPQARYFNELEVEGTATEISALEHVDLEPRKLQAKDFLEEESKMAVEG